MNMATNFLKGMGVGLLAGAALTAAIAPLDKKKVMRSGAGKTIKTIGQVMEHISGAF